MVPYVEEQHRQRLRLFDAIADTTPDFLYAFDLGGRFIYANRRLLEVWGRTFEQAVGKSLYELGYPQWHADMHMRELRQVIETRQPIKGEVPFTGGSGISGVYEYIFNPVLGPDGRVEIITGTTRDVTDRRRGEADRERLAAQFKLALDASHMGWWHYDPLDKRVTHDRRFGEIFGLSGEQRPAEDVLRLLHPDDLASEWAKIQAALDPTDPKPCSTEYRVSRADGSSRWVEAHASASFEGDGEQRRATALVGTVADVTARRSAEARDRFLLALDRAVRPLSDPAEITATCARRLGEHVGADRCAYADVEDDQDTFNLTGDHNRPGVPSIVGRYRFADFGAEVLRLMRADRPYVVDDVDAHEPPVGDLAAYRATSIQAVVCVPLHKGGRLVAAMAVHQRTRRRWTADEVGLVQQVAARCWESIGRARVERSLRESEERLRLGLEAGGTGLWDWDLASGRVTWSPRVYTFHGLTPETYDGTVDRFVQCVHPEDRDRVARAIQQSLRDGAPYDIEFRVVHPGGEVRWLTTTGKVFRDAAGNPIRMLGATSDVTRRKEDERAQAHLAALVESSDDAIISKTPDGIIQSWNAGARRIYGYTAEEAVGRPVLMLLPPERHDEEAAILARLRAGDRIDHFESVRVTKDGRRIDVSLTISPIRDAAGRIIGASKISRDITQQKQAERELQAAKAAAEEANRRKDELLESERAARAETERAGRIKDEFLATLSHELRTPLNAILGWAQILCATPSPPDVEQGVRVIERNARAQTQIIEDLLDMSRIASGKVRLDVRRLDLADVLTSAIETVRPAADAKAIRLQTVLDPNAGPVSGDPNRLQQVFWNLLNNAVKFTPKGGRVQVLLERVNSHVEVSVVDSGEGIPPEFLPHVFDRFRQADGGTTRRHGGLGLGLAIVKQLVEIHGGSVRAMSPGAGQGATFVVRLPLTAIQPGAEADAGVASRRPETGAVPVLPDLGGQIAGVRVLVVDDEADARHLVRRLLEDCGAVVATAASASEAYDRLRAEAFDVLVSDIGMPGEDGYSLIKRVRTLGPGQGGDVPAVALTAYARAEDRVKAVLAGFQMHVVKPVEPAELITMVASLAGRTG